MKVSTCKKRSYRDLNSDYWIQSPRCQPLHHRTRLFILNVNKISASLLFTFFSFCLFFKAIFATSNLPNRYKYFWVYFIKQFQIILKQHKMQRTQSKYNILTQKVNFSSHSHATDINSEKEIFLKNGLRDCKAKEKQNKIRSEFGVFQQLSGSKKQCKLKINWKGKSGKINRQMHIINDSEKSIKRLQLSDLNESSAQLNPQDTDTSKDEQQHESLLYGLRQFETQTSLGSIILSRHDHEQHCFKLILNYYRLQTFIKYVEMTCENIELRPNQKSKGYVYKLENLPPPIQSLRNYCVQVLQTIRQIFKNQDQHNLSIQSKTNCRDWQWKKFRGNIFRHEYAFPFEDKTIQLGISQQGEAIISIYEQLQQLSIESAQSSSTHDPKPKLMQVHKFANLDLFLKPHHRHCLASLMGQALLAKIIQIYTNHWFLYVADL